MIIQIAIIIIHLLYILMILTEDMISF